MSKHVPSCVHTCVHDMMVYGIDIDVVLTLMWSMRMRACALCYLCASCALYKPCKSLVVHSKLHSKALVIVFTRERSSQQHQHAPHLQRAKRKWRSSETASACMASVPGLYAHPIHTSILVW